MLRLAIHTKSFLDKNEAESALIKMDKKILESGHTTIRDYYDIFGFEHDEFSVTSYGWTSLEDAFIYRTRTGYEIEMPIARELEEE